jgi:hypothetical protein
VAAAIKKLFGKVSAADSSPALDPLVFQAILTPLCGSSCLSEHE